MAEMEECVLRVVLKWKLCYKTPFDYIHALASKLRTTNAQFYKVADIVIKKAIQISELLLICIPWYKSIAYDTLDKHSVLSIALASLYGAMEILNVKNWTHCMNEYGSIEIIVFFFNNIEWGQWSINSFTLWIIYRQSWLTYSYGPRDIRRMMYSEYTIIYLINTTKWDINSFNYHSMYIIFFLK